MDEERTRWGTLLQLQSKIDGSDTITQVKDLPHRLECVFHYGWRHAGRASIFCKLYRLCFGMYERV